MNKDEILDTIDLLGEGLDHLPDWVIRKRYNDDSITKAREYLKELQSSSLPPTPVIPDEVRKTLDAAIDDHGILINDDERNHRVPQEVINEEREATEQARRWLAQCPTATDKAVCPKCGSEEFLYVAEQLIENTEAEAHCTKCDHVFEVSQIIVISPPREVKP